MTASILKKKPPPNTVSIFPAIKLCFVINVLNNNNILLNLAEYILILANSALTASSAKYQVIFCTILQDNIIIVK